VGRPLWREVCTLHLLLGLYSAVSVGFDSHRTHDHVLLSHIWDSLSVRGQVTVFISPRHKLAQLCNFVRGLEMDRLHNLSSVALYSCCYRNTLVPIAVTKQRLYCLHLLVWLSFTSTRRARHNALSPDAAYCVHGRYFRLSVGIPPDVIILQPSTLKTGVEFKLYQHKYKSEIHL
jgi:hypothetical protein